MDTPFLLIGDGWQNPTGLARIARDLQQILGEVADPYHVGFHPPGLVHAATNARQWSWSHLGEDWGAEFVVSWIRTQFNPLLPGVVLLVWDPIRTWSYLQQVRAQLPAWQIWGYFAVDGHTLGGRLGQAADVTIKNVDRVLAYTEYGMRTMREIRGRSVSALPHGLSVPAFEYDPSVAAQLIPRYGSDPAAWLMGCVATNQPRKDLHLYFRLLRELRDRGERVYGWLHTDELVKHWAIPELVDQCGVQKWMRVTTGQYTDQQLHQLYAACTLTVCVGRGEGFGYPIVESLACGTPVVAMDYAGGAELTPARWRYQYQGVDYSHNQAAIGRPLASFGSVVERVLQVLDDTRRWGQREMQEYCKGGVAHLDWQYLKPRWESWVRKGLEEI